MNDQEFEALVRRLEAEEKRSPSDHKTRVALLALLGYGYIGLILLALLGLLAGTVMIMASGLSGGLIKVVIALLVAAGFIVKAMWVRFDPPEGRRLSRTDAPALFADAESIAQTLRAPRADVVLLTTDFNASVTQIPRLGMLGFSRNYLCIGAPLLAALPTEHVRAVLAHEFAHLSHAHGKFGSWCYRVRVTWFQLLQALEREEHWSTGIFRWFFRWYVPYFSAYTLVLMRRHEFEADQLAADIVGREQMAQTLVDLEVRADALARRFWPGTWEAAKEQPAPPLDIYARLAATTTALLPAEFGAEAIRAAWSRVTEVTDSHPALHERVLHLVANASGAPTPSPSFADSAATKYLAPNHDRLLSELSAKWRAEATANWNEQHKALAEAREGLAAMAQRPAEELSPQERFQFASWTEDVHGSQAALPLFEALHASDPLDVGSAFNVGRLRVQSGDASGVPLLEDVMSREPSAIIPCCEIAAAFLERTSEPQHAVPFREKSAARQALLAAAQQERSGISVDDQFSPSDLPDEQRAALSAQLHAIPEVARAFLVRKKVEHFAEESPMHVFAVYLSGALVTSVSQLHAASDRVIRSVTVPDNVHLFVLTDSHTKLLKPIGAVSDSLVYNSPERQKKRGTSVRGWFGFVTM